MKRSYRKTRTWEDVIDFLMDIDARYMLRRKKILFFYVLEINKLRNNFH